MEIAADGGLCHEPVYQKHYETHIDKLRNFVYYKCGDLDQASDLAQEAYIRLWKNCAKVVLESAMGFLFTTGNRLFLQAVRHQKVVLTFEKENAANHHAEDPSFLMEESEFKDKLEGAIAGLTEQQRQIFLLSRIDKLSYKEIAEAMDISVKGVEKGLGRAMKKLREQVWELNIHKI